MLDCGRHQRRETMSDPTKISAVAQRSWSFDLPPRLRLEATCEANSPVVRDFFKGYDRAFVLEDEKEPLSGFTECLELNDGAGYEKLSTRYGAYREIVLVAYDEQSSQRIGGANFVSFPITARGAEPCIGVNLNYIYVEKEARGRGYLKALLAGITQFIPSLFSHALTPLIFIEQNDPFRMSDKAYALDTRYSGLDQFDRLAIWLRVGARIVDFDYVQPPLSPHQKPDDSLVYAILNPSGTSLNACLLNEHLLRFFAISVLKGEDPQQDQSAGKQMTFLAAECESDGELELLDMSSAMIERAKQARKAAMRPPSLRDFIRGESK